MAEKSETKTRPILFSTPMIQAILEGRKVQTRRIIKPQPEGDFCDLNGYGNAVFEKDGKYTEIKARFQVGDTLWVRETWAKVEFAVQKEIVDGKLIDTDVKTIGGFQYRASYDESFCYSVAKWKPSIFMPREASRITLRITNIRVEKACDISEEDIFAEGIKRRDDVEINGKTFPAVDRWVYRSEFRNLWSKINGAETWNNWVWVIEFEVIKK